MSSENTPFAIKFLRTFCPSQLLEEIEGDLYQKYLNDEKLIGARRAKRRMLWSTLQYLRPGIILRHKKRKPIPQLAMLSNYFRIALRVMMRNKGFSMINIFGLALGLTGALLLGLWIQKEFSYDQFHADKERIYKAFNRNTIEGQLQCWDNTPRVLAPTLATDYSFVESTVSYSDYKAAYLFTVGDTKLMMNSGAFTDDKFFSIFSFPLVKGNPTKVFENPASLVLTESFARELFGDKEAFGETVTVGESGNSFPLTVTGIVKDLPSNTEIHFDYLIPFKFLESLEGKDTNWGNNSVSTYVKLRTGVSVDMVNSEIADIAKKHSKEDNTTEVFLYPLTKMRLYSRFENGVPAGGRIEIMRIMGILGGCLIAIACVNFINLSTARAQKRSKEVGIRKVTGAGRGSLIFQFICESILVALGAAILSLLAAYIALPMFSEMVRQPLSIDFQDLNFWAAILAIVVVIGILAGSYPAFYLSAFNPVKVLKGGEITSSGRNILRNLLVVFQFGFVVMLIFSVVVVTQQIEYVQNRDVGYSKDNLIYQFLTGDLEKNYAAYKTDLMQSGVVESVTKTSSPVTENWSSTWAINWHGKDPQSKIDMLRFYIDDNISKTAGLRIVQGRDLDLNKYPTDSTAALLNESAVAAMGFKTPIGETIEDSGLKWHVVGVIKDFVLTSPFQKVKPMVILGPKGWFTVVHIRLNPNKPVQESLDKIAELFSKHNPAYPFDYVFVDQAYARKFADVKSTLTITGVFSSIAIAIACLGLLGLSTYLIESKVKEIGVRKVLGGSVLSIVRLLTVHSLKPIFWAILIFSPQAWFAMHWWLESFQYRISISPFVFLISAVAIVGIALLTTVLQTYRAGQANTVKSLRSE
ncbi:MAG: ABC transporter permease [Bacteroidota bacterium]